MPFEKNQPRTVTLEMRDSSNVLQAGKTVTTAIAKDGVDFAAAVGSVAAISGGLYLFSGTAADFNFDAGIIKFSAPGCADTLLHINTESSYTELRAQGLDRAKKALPDVTPASAGGLGTVDASNRVSYDKTGVTLAGTQSFNNTGQSALIPSQIKGIDGSVQTALAGAIELELMNDGTGGAFMEAIATKLAQEFDIENLSLNTIRDAILNRVLPGNHDTANSVGALLQLTQKSGQAVTLPYAVATETKQDSYHTSTMTAIGNPMQAGTVTLSGSERTAIATAILTGANGVETGLSVKQAFQLMIAVVGNKTTNNGLKFRDFADTKDRLTVSIDSNGNRTVTVALD